MAKPIDTLLKKETSIILRSVLGEYSGDLLHHVNVCTMARCYLPTTHPILSRLAEGVSSSPSSQAAETPFDVVLRFLAISMLGKDTIALSREHLEMVGIKPDSLPGGPHHAILPIDFMFSCWVDAPLDGFFFEPKVFNLFSHYCARVYCHRPDAIPDPLRLALTSQLVGNLMALESRSREQGGSLCAASEILFMATSLAMMDRLELVAPLFKRTKQYLGSSNNETEPAKALQYLHLICISLNNLRGTFPEFTEDLLRSIGPHVREDFENNRKLINDLRSAAIRLAALRPVLGDREVGLIHREFDAAVTLDALIGLKSTLLDYSMYAAPLRELIQAENLTITQITAQELHRLINGITYEDVHNVVRYPHDTLLSKKGDCKAVTALLAAILLDAGKDAHVCFYPGKDIAVNVDNHIFIEWLEADGTAIPIDRTPDFGKYHSMITDSDAIIRYPLRALVHVSNREMLTEFGSLRNMVLSRLAKRTT